MKEFRCSYCDKRFDLEESLNQHKKAKHETKHESDVVKKGKRFRKYLIFFVMIIAILILSYTIYSNTKKPGKYDDFAKCLTEKDAIIYGNDFCSYTAKQLNWFGKSEKYLNYVKCVKNKELCDSKGIKITPTWEIDGKFYEQTQSLERLSELTGCEL